MDLEKLLTCRSQSFVHFEIFQQMNAAEQKEKSKNLIFALKPSFFRYFKLNKTDVIHISVTLLNCITHKNWKKISKLH